MLFAGWSTLTCDKCDSQMFAGGVRRSIGLGQMLCMSESHKSMQGPGTVDVIATEVDGGLVGERATDRWSMVMLHWICVGLGRFDQMFPFPVRFWSIFDQKPRSRFSSVRFPYANCDIYFKATTARHRHRVAGCASAAASIHVSCCVVQNELARNIIITQVAGPAVRTLLHTHSPPRLHVVLG